MALLDIPAYEQGVTRVFALSMTPDAAQRLRDESARQSTLLGAAALTLQGVEIFPISDLGELGLVGYLREGVDAQESDLARDGAKLAALEGWVMLLHSSAFAGEPTTLTLAPQITLVGTYSQQAAPAPETVLESDAAEPYSGAPPDLPTPSSRRLFGGAWMTAVLFGLALAFLWRVFT